MFGTQLVTSKRDLTQGAFSITVSKAGFIAAHEEVTAKFNRLHSEWKKI